MLFRFFAGDDESRVRGRIFDGVFEGMIKTSKETYQVEKADNFFRRDADRPFNTVVYKYVARCMRPLSFALSRLAYQHTSL